MNPASPIQKRSTADVEYQIKRWLPILVGLVLAVYAGYWVGNNNWTPLTRLVTIVIVCFVAFILQEHGWILIPAFWMATGSISLFPLPFAYRDLAIMLAAAAFLAHRSMVKTPPSTVNWVLFALLLVNLAWIGVAWLRKPVGFRVFGSEMVGARFYFNMFVAGVGSFVLVFMPQTVHLLKRIPSHLLAGTLIGAAANTITFVLPAATGAVLAFYGEATVYLGPQAEIQRFEAFRFAGIMAVLIIVSHSHPLTLFQPARPYLYLLLASLAGIAISGYRSAMLIAFAYIGLSMILRRNWRQLFLSSLIALVLLGALVFGQGRLYSLPLSVQRALCFLPGNWSPVAVADASATAETRFLWWKDIFKYRLIDNWWAGDGIGVRAAEMIAAQETARHNYAEAIFFYGSFHNGPLTTIRCIGIVGLILLFALLLLSIAYALRCLKRCRGTPFEPLALFVAIPIIWFPIHFTLVFGSFEYDMPQIIFQTGLLLLLGRMLDEHPELLTVEPDTA